MLVHLHPSEQKGRGFEQVVATVQHQLLLQLQPFRRASAGHSDG